jgi:hypothetical protein
MSYDVGKSDGLLSRFAARTDADIRRALNVEIKRVSVRSRAIVAQFLPC